MAGKRLMRFPTFVTITAESNSIVQNLNLSAKLKLFIIVFLLSLQIACALHYDERGRYHVVRKGETISTIAQGYRLSSSRLSQFNGIADPKSLRAGQKLYLPDRIKKKRFKKLPIDRIIEDEMRKDQTAMQRSGKAPRARKSKIHFRWPVKGSIMSKFGIRNGRRHDGIDIDADSGAPIYAAADGVVVFEGKMRGYGKLILLKHKANFFTAYAHNSANKVKRGSKVKSGDVIAKVGKTGRATGPHLHFEIREGQKARNPLFFLPVIR